jgi:hypothetical protein
VEVLDCQADFSQIAFALQAAGGFACRHERRQQQRDERA